MEFKVSISPIEILNTLGNPELENHIITTLTEKHYFIACVYFQSSDSSCD